MRRKESDESWDDLRFFTKKGARISNPKITITENQAILFSSGFFHKANLEDKSYVKLAYSPSNRAIFFDFTEDPNAEGAFRLIHRGGSGSTTCRSFFNANDLEKAKTVGHYVPDKKRIPRIGEMWFIRLDERIQ